MAFQDVFEREVSKAGLKWCKNCARRSDDPRGETYSYSHNRGFMTRDKKGQIIHYSRKFGTRRTLFAGLYMVGRFITSKRKNRAWQNERDAIDWTIEAFRRNQISVPSGIVEIYRRYQKRSQKRGKAISDRMGAR